MTSCQGPLTMFRSSSPVSAKAEKKAEAQMKFNSQGVLGDGGGGRYGEQLAYLGCLPGIVVVLFGGQGQHGQASIGSL